MVGMQMGDQHAQHRQAVERGREDLFPGRLRRRSAMPQSTIVQPSRPSSRSRSSQTLTWSSANGSGSRSQRTPGATSSSGARRRQRLAERIAEFAFLGVGHGQSGKMIASIECSDGASLAVIRPPARPVAT